LALLLVINLNLLYPMRLELPPRYMITSLVPFEPPVPQTPQPVNPRLTPKLSKPAIEAPPVTASLTLPPLPKPKKPEAEVKAPVIQTTARLPELPNQRPAVKVIATNTFSTGSSAMPTTNRPAPQVQTGGFGDPNGVPARAGDGHAVNINAFGSWDLPSGPGRGNGLGGANGVPGVVASAGFGNGVAVGGPRNGNPNGSVKPAGFADSSPAPEAQPRKAAAKEPPTTPVEILAKPKPNYTEEGRKLKIEGEVRLEVQFTATGEVHVIRVLQGLGHGLDEQAVRAAEQIKFKPAQREGKPVDSNATLHIIFQLA
jgi:TonB family protein